MINVPGRAYDSVDLASNATLTKTPDGGVTLQSDRTTSTPSTLTWSVPSGAIPVGHRIRSIDTRICGSGTGDFWENYGPPGSNPDEHEFEKPGLDGCWDYTGAPGPDTTVTAAIRTASTLHISRIEYTVAFVP